MGGHDTPLITFPPFGYFEFLWEIKGSYFQDSRERLGLSVSD